MSLPFLSLLASLVFALGRRRVWGPAGPASLILFMLQGDTAADLAGRAFCVCTAGIWLSDLVEHALGRWSLIAPPFARAVPLAAAAMDPSLLSWSCMDSYLPATAAATMCIAAADGLIRIKRSGLTALKQEYGRGALRILLLSLLGAAAEEVLFRGVLLNALVQSLPAFPALTASALLFGFFHFTKGSPSGWTGVLETFVLGMLMGALVLGTGGIASAVVVHGIGIPYLLRLASSLSRARAEGTA